LLITHDIETVFAVAESITVLRLGSVVHHGPVRELDEITLLQMMAGFYGRQGSHKPTEHNLRGPAPASRHNL
jgi:ABC-type sugar transport system ATPase subunit